VADDKAGAGHGGMGGKGSVADSGGYFYGDVLSPRHFGSNAKYSDTEVYGGGIINIVASVSSSIDGKYIKVALAILSQPHWWCNG
jgi:hypothetical protein